MRTTRATILVAPLDWGLGHATRCIPVIDELINQGSQVVIGGSGIGMKLLEDRYPNLCFEELPSYGITYPLEGSMSAHIAKLLPKIYRAINKEKMCTDEIIRKHKLTHIISDNRYGIYSSRVPSVIMTHQVHILSGTGLALFDQMLFRAHRSMLERFDRIWIVDNAAEARIACELSSSKGLRKPFEYTGILSRFNGKNQHWDTTASAFYARVAILSGPEPQRSLFEEKIVDFFRQLNEPCLIVRGTGGKSKQQIGHLTMLDSMDDQAFLKVLHPETILHSRPGYSTLMDLAYLRHQKVVFTPTPGQTEQEYLGNILQEQYGYTCIHQDSSFSLTPVCEGRPLPQPTAHQLANCVANLLQTN